MFSKACEYGIRAVIFLTTKSKNGERVNINIISNEINSPPAFTAKVLQKLVKGNIVSSLKGPQGGFYIKEEAIAKVRLVDIVRIIDGDSIYNSCAIGLKDCSALKPCPLHDEFKSIRLDIKRVLEETSLTNLAEQLKKGLSVLKI